MVERLLKIDSVKYLENSLSFTNKEKQLVKEFSNWLPKEIIDCHTHCGLLKHVKDVDEEMFHQMISTFESFSLEDSHRVKKAFFEGKTIKRLRFPFPLRGIDIKGANEYLSTNVKDPNKIALCGIPNDVDYTNSMLKTGRFSALKMYHQQSNPPLKQIYEYFPPKVLEVAEKLDIPIILHLPKMITLCKDELLDVIKTFPNLRISLAHLGLPHLVIPNLEATYEEIARNPNISMDTAMVPSKEVVKMAIKAFGPKRIMFGSDEPINLVKSVVYQNPTLGQRVITEYMYHWVDRAEHEEYKALAVGSTHMHWYAIIAVKDAIEDLYPNEKQADIKSDIFNKNASKFFKFI